MADKKYGEEEAHALHMRILSYEPKYSRGRDDIDDPLPNGSFYAHVSWRLHRLVNYRATPKISYVNYGAGDLYFYHPKGMEWQYEFRFLPDQFRCGCVSTNINCDSFMRWFVDHMNYGGSND